MGIDDAIEQRLDKAMEMAEWLHIFPQVKLPNLVVAKSNHSMLLLLREVVVQPNPMRGFKFKNIWLLEPNFKDVVVEGWNRGNHGDVVPRLDRCSNTLLRWGRRVRTKFRNNIDFFRSQLEVFGIEGVIIVWHFLSQQSTK